MAKDKKKATYKNLEEFNEQRYKRNTELGDSIRWTCISCGDVFYPIKCKDPKTRCPACGTTNIVK